jgi:hypothetical protein
VPPPHRRTPSAPVPAGPAWRVSRTDLTGGLTALRYAYMDGAAANVVVKTIGAGLVDDDLLASYVRAPPPPPQKT